MARSRRTRLAIVDALRALHIEGDLAPTVDAVATRAGISRRTVWQHFADREALFLEAGRRDLEIAASMVERIDPDQPLDARIALYTSRRAQLFEAMTPGWRAGRLQEPYSEQIRRNKRDLQEAGRKELRRLFRAELVPLPAKVRAEVEANLFVVTGWSAWESYRADAGLSVEAARTAVATAVTALLAHAAPATSPQRGRNPGR